ncbi:MAG: helix-turn-helix domain-containing protein, partial [Candidatus Acidiferrales bacterium]
VRRGRFERNVMSSQSLHDEDAASTADSEERDRRTSGRDRILEFLRARGAGGATNVELNAICFRYGARIWELRRQGFVIATERAGGGTFRFTLKSESLLGGARS